MREIAQEQHLTDNPGFVGKRHSRSIDHRRAVTLVCFGFNESSISGSAVRLGSGHCLSIDTVWTPAHTFVFPRRK
jgi:hypothetical protein